MTCRTNRLSFERLESRELMHGNVLASVVTVSGVPELFITEAVGEASQANTVQISRLANGKVRVIGGNNSEGTFTRINGLAGQDFTLPITGDLVVDLGGSDDQLQINNARFGNVFIGMGAGADTVTATNLKTSGRATIDAGDGANQVFVRNSTVGDTPAEGLTINTGAGNDNVELTGSKTFGRVGVLTGAGQDNVFVRSSTIGSSPAGDLDINTGAGADLVEVGVLGQSLVRVKGNLIVNTFTNINEPDMDFVRINQTISDKLIAVDTGAGNDDVKMAFATGHDVVLVAGQGDDKALMTQVSAVGQMFLFLSEGNDTLNMTSVRAGTLLTVDGGTGVDRLEHHADAHNLRPTFTGWEFINGLSATINPGALNNGLMLTL
jgi:hypothetical protein